MYESLASNFSSVALWMDFLYLETLLTYLHRPSFCLNGESSEFFCYFFYFILHHLYTYIFFYWLTWILWFYIAQPVWRIHKDLSIRNSPVKIILLFHWSAGYSSVLALVISLFLSTKHSTCLRQQGVQSVNRPWDKVTLVQSSSKVRRQVWLKLYWTHCLTGQTQRFRYSFDQEWISASRLQACRRLLSVSVHVQP